MFHIIHYARGTKRYKDLKDMVNPKEHKAEPGYMGVFMVSGLIFKSLVHFKFIFVYGVRKCSNFILLHVAIQFSQYNDKSVFSPIMKVFKWF